MKNNLNSIIKIFKKDENELLSLSQILEIESSLVDTSEEIINLIALDRDYDFY